MIICELEKQMNRYTLLYRIATSDNGFSMWVDLSRNTSIEEFRLLYFHVRSKFCTDRIAF